MATSTETVKIKFVAETGKATKGVKGLNTSLDNQGKKVGKLKGGLTSLKNNWMGATVAIGAAAAAMNKMVNLAAVQENAESKLNAVLKSTKEVAGLTATELKKMASGLQAVTTYGDEAIIETQAMMLTFTGIGKDVFPQATEAILDMSTAMNTDLKSSTIMLGKVLNDPIKNLSAMTRNGIQFTDAQKSMIKTLWEAGDAAGAQSIILGELNTQFGGQARAAAQTYAGQIKQTSNALGDVGETIGQAVMPVILVFANAMKTIAEAFEGANPIVKQAATYIGLLGVGIGVATIAMKAFGLSTRTALIASGIGAIVLGLVVAVAYMAQNWDLVKIAMMEFAQAINTYLNKALNLAIDGINQLISAYNSLTGSQKPLIDGYEEVNKSMQRNIDKAKEDLANKKDVDAKKVELQANTNLALSENQAETDEDEGVAIQTQNEKKIIWAEQTATQIGQIAVGWAKNASSQIGRINNQLYKNRGIEIDNYYKKEKSAIESSRASEEEKARRMEKLDAEVDKKRKKLARDAARSQKKQALFSIALDTSSAIMSAMSDLEYPANLIAAIAVSALGAAEAAAVASEPLPAAAEGALIKGSQGGTPILAGEAGRSEMIVPFENEEVQDRVGGIGGGGNITIQIENLYGDDTLPTKVAEAFDTALLRLKQNNMSSFAESF